MEEPGLDPAALYEKHSRELLVHCYRMVGSFSEAEDMMQETFVKAMQSAGTFEGRSTPRAWLYRIATNACLDHLRRRNRRRVLPFDVMDPYSGGEPMTEGDWLWVEPFPDGAVDPETLAVNRETLELAFIAAIQYLPPRQRATLIARDVLGWSTEETAELLGAGKTAVKSSLQRARATLGRRLPSGRDQWTSPPEVTEEEREILNRYIRAMDDDDEGAMAAVLREDLRVAYPQIPLWAEGRDVFIEGSREQAPPGDYGFVATTSNFQPAVAIYLRPPGAPTFELTALEVLTVRDGLIVEIVDYDLPELASHFGLERELVEIPT